MAATALWLMFATWLLLEHGRDQVTWLQGAFVIISLILSVVADIFTWLRE